MTLDYFATQRTGSACAPFNCAAASGAMGLAAGSLNAIRLTADDFRAESHASCVPGAHSPSGGLFISDVIRVYDRHGIEIDYGATGTPPEYTRWPAATLPVRLDRGYGAVLLGDYDALPKEFRASATFNGTHSAWVHDRITGTLCWHDPLRFKPIRIPVSAAVSYWQKPGPVKGFAGFVRIPQEDDVTIKARVVQAVSGTVTVGVDGASLVTFDGRRVDVPKGQVRECVAEVALLEPLDSKPGDRTAAYLVGRIVPEEPFNSQMAYLLKSAAIPHLVKVVQA